MNSSKIALIGLAVMAGLVTSASAAIVVNETDFSTILQGDFIAGTSTNGIVYTQKGNMFASQNTTGIGNPGNALNFGNWGSQIVVGIDAPAASQTWTIAFDHAAGSGYSATASPLIFRVIGLTNETVNNKNATVGIQLGLLNITKAELANTAWTTSTSTISVPSGYSTIAVQMFFDGNGLLLDNISVDNGVAVPEPSTYALAFGGVIGLLVMLRCRSGK